MDGRSKTIAGNSYAQVFANDKYFAKPYPMDNKWKSNDASKQLCRDFGVQEQLTIDGSREHTCKGTTFMKTVRRYNTDFQIYETDLNNQNPAEGEIRELRKKWFRTMIRTKCPKQLWD